MLSSYSSSRKTRRSNSTMSTSSQSSHRSTHTYSTNATFESDIGPVIKWSKFWDKSPCQFNHPTKEDQEDCLCVNEDDPRSSVETYASTVPSERDLDQAPEYELPQDRPQVYEPDSIPATASNFSSLFPTRRRILIQHDDSTSDGNMNLRLDTEAVSQEGELLKVTLFHLRMKNLHERQFSLRRYCRDSGREICSSKKKYAKPLPPSLQRRRSSLPRPLSTALQRMGIKPPRSPRSVRSVMRQESDDESDEDDVELELQKFTLNSEVKATIPTNTIRLEFSNYAQVEVHRLRQGGVKKYDFEYWGEPYTWQREADYDDGGVFYSYELLNLKSGKCIAYISHDKLDAQQSWLEEAQGGWIPPSSLRIRDEAVSEDLGDVIVATGLVALADDCIKRRWHSTHSTRTHMPTKSSADYVEPERVADGMVGSKSRGSKMT